MITDPSTELSSRSLDKCATRRIVLDYNGLSIGTSNTTIVWKTNIRSLNYSVNVFTNDLERELTESMLRFNKSIESDTNTITIPTNETTGHYFNIRTVQDNCSNSSSYYFSFHQKS